MTTKTRCTILIGHKDNMRTCDLPVRENEMCNYHRIALDGMASKRGQKPKPGASE